MTLGTRFHAIAAGLVLLSAAVVGPALAARERAPGAPQRIRAAVPVPSAESQAPTSAGLLVERLGFLGVPKPDAQALLDDLQAGALTLPGLKARLAGFGLAAPQAEKAFQLAVAFTSGRPIAHVGVDPEVTTSDLAWTLAQSGTDPDAAAWAAVQPEGEVELGSLPRRLPAPSPAIATCKTCPQVNYAFTPTTTRQSHLSSVEGTGCVMYRFALQAGRTYRFSTCAADGGSTAFDSLFTSWTTNCVPGASSDDACGLASRLEHTTTVAGYLYLRVSSLAGSGAFRITYQDLGALCRSCPQYDRSIASIPLGGASLTDSFPANGCRTYRFATQANRVYRFSTCPGTPGGLDTVMETSYANCSAGPSNDDACPDLGSEVVVPSPGASAIYVKIRGFAGAGGSFTLWYDDVTDECHGCPVYNATLAAPMYDYRTAPGAVAPWQCYTYRIPLTAGRTYRFSTCGTYGGSSTFDSGLVLFDPSCGYVTDSIYDCAAGADLLVTATTTGYHYLSVYDLSGTGGTFNLVLGLYAAGCPYSEQPLASPTTAYQLVEGAIWEPGQVVRHSFPLGFRRIYRLSFCDGSGGYGNSAVAAWYDQSCSLMNGTFSSGPFVESDCFGFDTNLQNNVARTSYVEVYGPAGAYGLGYKEVPCHQWWVAGASDPGFGGTTYGSNPVATGTFTQFRIQVTPGGTYTFSTCAGDGAATASFDSRLEIYQSDACVAMPVTRTICGDDERVVVSVGSQSFVMVRIIDESNLGGNFQLYAKRNS